MVNVFYAGNKKVFDMIMISSYSMAKTASEPISVYIVTMDLSNENPKYVPITNQQAEFLQDLIQKYNKDNRVILLDVTDIYLKHRFVTQSNVDRFTPFALLRLFADYYDFPEKIIYLDVDTVINNDIAELYNQDITDYEVGVVRDVFIFGQRLNKTYFNSGMMLMNIPKIKETKYLEKARKYCSEEKRFLLDQDALNYTVTYKKMLDRKFNSIHVPKKRYDKVVVHHMCDCRAFVLIRYKSRNFKMVKRFMPFYRPLIDEIIGIKENANI